MRKWFPDMPSDYSVDDYIAEKCGSKSIEGKTYGMGEYAVSRLNVISTIDGGNTIDWEKFNSGDYVLVSRWTNDDKNYLNFVEPGDKVKGYTVYAVVDIPLAMQFRVFNTFNCYFILPEDEYLAVNGDCGAMRTLIDVDDDKEAAVEEWLKNYTTTVNPDMDYDSKDTIKGEYDSFNNMIRMVGIVLATILGLIGLMNFANTMVTSIIVRSREFAMLEAVGMTGRQQKQKLMKEGFTYFIWTAIASIILSVILSVTALRLLVGGFPMFDWHFTIMPIVICLPFICLMVIMIPVIAYRRLSKRSVVDRLRVE